MRKWQNSSSYAPEMLQTLQEWTDAWYEEKLKKIPTWLESANPRLNSQMVGTYAQIKHMDYPAWALGE